MEKLKPYVVFDISSLLNIRRRQRRGTRPGLEWRTAACTAVIRDGRRSNEDRRHAIETHKTQFSLRNPLPEPSVRRHRQILIALQTGCGGADDAVIGDAKDT